MKNTCVLDANVVLRYLLADHPAHYQQAEAFMSEVKSGQQRVYLPESVLVECVYVLLKRIFLLNGSSFYGSTL